MSLLSILKEKKSDNLDAPSTTLEHREILLNKPFLRKIYEEWYRSFIEDIAPLPQGAVVELGSGGGFLKEMLPEALCSDILPLPHCDLTFSATHIPIKDESVRAIFMIDVLHHIPECELFFEEAARVLVKGGLLFMIEPANTKWSRTIYKNLHHEPFDPDNTQWTFATDGPLSGANGALPWMIFHRDIDKFHQKYPTLQLASIDQHTPFRYLMTGGLSYKTLLPGWSFGIISSLEKLFSPLKNSVAMFQTIRVKKDH